MGHNYGGHAHPHPQALEYLLRNGNLRLFVCVSAWFFVHYAQSKLNLSNPDYWMHSNPGLWVWKTGWLPGFSGTRVAFPSCVGSLVDLIVVSILVYHHIINRYYFFFCWPNIVPENKLSLICFTFTSTVNLVHSILFSKCTSFRPSLSLSLFNGVYSLACKPVVMGATIWLSRIFLV